MSVCVPLCVYECVCVRAHPCTCVYVYICMLVYMCVPECTFMGYMYKCAYLYPWLIPIDARLPPHAHPYVPPEIQIYLWVPAWVCTRVCVCVCVCCAHMCLSLCPYVCLCVGPSVCSVCGCARTCGCARVTHIPAHRPPGMAQSLGCHGWVSLEGGVCSAPVRRDVPTGCAQLGVQEEVGGSSPRSHAVNPHCHSHRSVSSWLRKQHPMFIERKSMPDEYLILLPGRTLSLFQRTWHSGVMTSSCLPG